MGQESPTSNVVFCFSRDSKDKQQVCAAVSTANVEGDLHRCYNYPLWNSEARTIWNGAIDKAWHCSSFYLYAVFITLQFITSAFNVHVLPCERSRLAVDGCTL